MDFRSLHGAAHPRVPWYREVPRQGPARSRLQRQKPVLGEDYSAEDIALQCINAAVFSLETPEIYNY